MIYLDTSLNARDLARTHGDAARQLLARLAFLELRPDVLDRARAPFPSSIRTLDALHLASMAFLRAHGQAVTLATYDERMARAADAMDVPLLDLP